MSQTLDYTPLTSDWTDLRDMLTNIRQHVLSTGDTVMQGDDLGFHYQPRRVARLGYISRTGRVWTIQVTRIGEKPLGPLEELIKTSEGKRKILEALNGEPDPQDLDRDLELMDRDQLVQEARRLRAGIRQHRDAKGHNLCWYVPELWDLLPDKARPSPEPPPRDEFLHHCAVYRDSLNEHV